MSFEDANRPQPIDQQNEVLRRVQKVFMSVLLLVGMNLSVDYVLGAETEVYPVVYHVYDEGAYVGELADVGILDELIADKLEKAYAQFNSDTLMLGNQLSVVPEHVFTTRPEDEETIEVIKDKLFIKTKATIVTVDGQSELYVKDEDTYDQIIRRLKLQLVSEQELMKLEAREHAKITPESLKRGERRIIDIIMHNRLKAMTGIVRPEEVVTEVIQQQNDEVLDRSIKKEEIIVEPHGEVAVVGTKELPSQGMGTFIWPADGGYVSSQMGERWGSYHRGIDIARPTTRTVVAADNGVVTSAERHETYGNKVVIDHNNGYETLYAHLASIDVTAGQIVSQGATIGEMGSTGRSTGIHLHFEVTNDGELVNPLTMVSE